MSLWSLVSRPLLGLSVAFLLTMSPAEAADLSEPVVKLLDAGSGKKKELRTAPKAGTTETFEMLIGMDMVMDMGGMGKMPQSIPTMKMVMEANVTSVDRNGDIHYDFTLSEVAVIKTGAANEALMIAAMQPELEKMVGTKGSVVVSDTGVTKETKLVPPEGADPDQFEQMQKSMNHASAPFPVEAVGVGAKWQVTQHVADNGLALDQTVTYTLAERKGDVVKLDIALVQSAEPQQFGGAAMPPGAKAELISLVSSGTGSTEFDLTHLFPTKSKLEHDMKTRMSIDMNGQKMEMGMDMALDLDMARK